MGAILAGIISFAIITFFVYSPPWLTALTVMVFLALVAWSYRATMEGE